MQVEDQDALRTMLSKAGLVAFVGNGSILPRASGADDKVRWTLQRAVNSMRPLML